MYFLKHIALVMLASLAFLILPNLKPTLAATNIQAMNHEAEQELGSMVKAPPISKGNVKVAINLKIEPFKKAIKTAFSCLKKARECYQKAKHRFKQCVSSLNDTSHCFDDFTKYTDWLLGSQTQRLEALSAKLDASKEREEEILTIVKSSAQEIKHIRKHPHSCVYVVKNKIVKYAYPKRKKGSKFKRFKRTGCNHKCLRSRVRQRKIKRFLERKHRIKRRIKGNQSKAKRNKIYRFRYKGRVPTRKEAHPDNSAVIFPGK